MSAERSLYPAVLEHIQAVTMGSGMGSWSVSRLAVLTTGIIAAKSCVLGQVAAAIWGLRLSAATEESIAASVSEGSDAGGEALLRASGPDDAPVVAGDPQGA